MRTLDVVLTLEDLRAALRERLKTTTVRALATELKCDHVNIHRCAAGEDKPTPRLLAGMGLRVTVAYEPIKPRQNSQTKSRPPAECTLVDPTEPIT